LAAPGNRFHPAVFASEDAQELLPGDLRGLTSSEPVSVVIKQPESPIAAAPLVD